MPEKSSTSIHNSRGLMPGPGPNGPSGSSGRITIDITANRAAASIVGSSSRSTKPWSRGFSASSRTVSVVSAADSRRKPRPPSAPAPSTTIAATSVVASMSLLLARM